MLTPHPALRHSANLLLVILAITHPGGRSNVLYFKKKTIEQNSKTNTRLARSKKPKLGRRHLVVVGIDI